MARKGIKEYRAPEALALISADRDHTELICPSCGADTIDRNPKRTPKGSSGGRITLRCTTCDRSAKYILPVSEKPLSPDV